MKIRAFEWFESWPQEVQIGIILVIGSWFLFMLTLPLIKLIFKRRWRKLRAEQCRRKQKTFWKIIIWIHVFVLSFSTIGLDYAQDNIVFREEYVDAYLSYFFVIVGFCMVLPILYEALKEYVVNRFGPDPKKPKWEQFFDFIVNYLKAHGKKIKNSESYNRISKRLKQKTHILYLRIRGKIKKIKDSF